MVVSFSTYVTLYFFATIIAIGLQLSIATQLGSFLTEIYTSYKAIRTLVKGFLFCTIITIFFYLFGRSIIASLVFVSQEYRHLTGVAIISFFALRYIARKGYYEILNVFGAIIFMLWLFIFSGILIVHLSIEHRWLDRSFQLFNYLVVELPGNFKILPYLIVLCLIMMVLLLNIINFSRIQKIIAKYINDRIKDASQDSIMELIYNDSDKNIPESTQISLNRLKRYRFTRTIFTDELLRMHEIIFGNINDRINQILSSWEVIHDARFYLHHRLWHYKIKGLRVYAQLGDKSELQYMKHLIHAKNHVLRIEAQVTLARLSNEDNPLDYLKDLHNRLTLWEQINLIHYFARFNKPIGNVSNLLVCENHSVTFFGLRLAGVFNQYEHYNQIIKLTKYGNTLIQDTAYEALSQYQEPASAEYIMKKFNNELPMSTKIAMIRALGHIGNANALPFLKDMLLFEVDYQLSIELFKSIIQIDEMNYGHCDTVGDLKIIILGEFINESKI